MYVTGRIDRPPCVFPYSHAGQSFSLSSFGPISISRANTHMVYMGRKLALHITF